MPRLALVVSASLLLAACGTSSSAPFDAQLPAAQLHTLEIPADPFLDGMLRSDGFVDMDGFQMRTGDTLQDKGMRSFVSFDLSEMIPADAEILEATFTIRQMPGLGDPFPVLGPVVLDRIQYDVPLAGKFDLVPLEAAFAVLTDDVQSLMREVDVTAQVQADHAAEFKRAQFRLRHLVQYTNWNGQTDRANFQSADTNNPNIPPPMLTIVYK